MVQDPNNVAQSTEETEVAAPETAAGGNGGGEESTEAGTSENAE